MPQHDLVLGLDVGTTNLKCLALDGAGTIVAQGSEPTPRSHPRPGWTDFEPEPIWEADAQRSFGAFQSRSYSWIPRASAAFSKAFKFPVSEKTFKDFKNCVFVAKDGSLRYLAEFVGDFLSDFDGKLGDLNSTPMHVRAL